MGVTLPQDDTNVVGRMERRVSDYMDERRAVKRKAVRELFGKDEDPSMEQMTAYNTSLQPYIKELIAFQGKIFENDKQRTMERTKVTNKMLDAVQAVIRSRADNATGMNKARLIEYGRNITNLQKGLDLATSASDDVLYAPQGEEAVFKAANAAMEKSSGENFNATQIGAALVKQLPNKAEREEALRRLEVYLDDNQTRIDPETVRSSMKTAAAAHGLPGEVLSELGATDPSSAAYVEMGHAMGSDPASAVAMFVEQRDRIDAMQASSGGSFGATMAELAGAMTSGDTEEMQEALNDIVGEIGMTAEEAMLHSNQERHKEVLLGQLYNPNAPSSVEIARDQLLQDPGFLTYKDSMGFSTDRAAFISLKRQMRKSRRKKKRKDRQLLRGGAGISSPQSMNALKALQENEDKARVPGQGASPSAALTQHADPASTKVKVGGDSGGNNTP